jgi:16S rRNA (cytosine1402-N4)-methyltransferase
LNDGAEAPRTRVEVDRPKAIAAPLAESDVATSDDTVVHVPIMVREVMECLRPVAGDLAVDCTLGSGGHARHLLRSVLPGGRLVAIDVDPIELPRTEARLRSEGYGESVFVARRANFAALKDVLAQEDRRPADVILVDLGVSAMQFDQPARGFSYKGVGSLDMRMNPEQGDTAAHLIARLSEADLVRVLAENADEPFAALIAHLLKQQPCDTTHAAERRIRRGLQSAEPSLTRSAIKMSTRRTFQALRIAVNDEFGALDALLASLPDCLAPGGRVAVLTFHSGEDRRVKKAFQAGQRAGDYCEIADRVIRSQKAETFSNRRASPAKLRWARRSFNLHKSQELQTRRERA